MSESLQLGLIFHTPDLILLATAIFIVFADSLSSKQGRMALGGYALLGTLLALAFATVQGFAVITAEQGVYVFGKMAMSDGVASLGRIIILGTLVIGILLGYRQSINREFRGEFHALILFSTFGALVMSNAANLVVLVLGLEILSLPLYTLAAFDFDKHSAREAGLKYIILGAFSSAFLVLGCAFYFAGTGSLAIRGVLPSPDGQLLHQLGTALILSGMMFKGGMLPFFAWSPDVYHGAPDFAVGLMASLAKLGTFLILLRIMPEFVPSIAASNVMSGLILATAGTMLVGNLLALVQKNIKRLLAFSSVAHAGYMFLGLLAFRPDASAGVLFYLAVYAPVLVLTFHIVSMFPGSEDGHDIEHYNGIGTRTPFVAAVFSLCLISLAGLPPTAGFMAKAVMFLGTIQGGLVNMVIFAMLVSVIGVYYYLRVIVHMYMIEPDEGIEPFVPSLELTGPLGTIGIFIVGLIVIVIGIAPAFLIYLATMAIEHLDIVPYLPVF